MQTTVRAAPQRVHHHQRGTAAVLALVPLLPPLLPAPSLPSRPAPMPLTLAALLVAGPRAAAPRQFLLGGRGDRLAVDLDDQYVAIIRRQWTFAQIDISGPGQAQDPLLDRRGRRCRPQKHLPESAGDLEAHPRGQPAAPPDEQRGVSVAGQPQRHVQGVDTVPAAAARHEERPDVGDRPATGLEGPLGGGVRHAIAAGLPGPRVEPIMTCPEEELDQQASQRPQESQQGRLELEERRGSLVIRAVRDDLVEPLMGLCRRSSTVGGQAATGGLLAQVLMGTDS